MPSEAKRYKSFYLPESKPHLPRSRDFQTEHIRLEVDVDLWDRRIEGKASLRLVPLKEVLQRVSLDAVGMEVRRVALDGSECQYECDDNRLIMTPSLPLSKGKHLVVVEYAASPARGLYFIQPDEAYPRKELQAWTLSEAELARYWYPCYDYPNDKSSSEMILTVPEGYMTISNGKLISTSRRDGKTTYHWREDTPHSTYLNSFVVGKFGEMVEEVDGTRLEYYFPESKRKDVMRYFGETGKMMKVFGELTGVKYPHAKYSQTTVEDFILGGMENISAATLTTTRFPDERSEEDYQASYNREARNAVNLVAHELAHQWFGDLVTCSEWSHAWLNEALSTYFQCLYLEKSRGVDFFRRDLALRAEFYFEEDETRYRRPIVERNLVYPDDVFDYTTYEKGAWMLHQLRFILGDALFFKGIREYLRQFSRAVADSEDFRKVFERVSGVPLVEYFDEFFYKSGYPDFEIQYEWDDADSSATVIVRQTQETNESTPIFRLPCEVVFYTRRGRVEQKVEVSMREEKFKFVLDSKPRIVEFDPQEWILKRLKFPKNLELIATQLRESRDASSRSRAAADLGSLKNNAALAALEQAAREDQFWGVRARAIESLGEIGTAEAMEVLNSLGIPENRRVRKALAKALGAFKDERGRRLLERLLLDDPSPFVQSEAAISLAKAHPGIALNLLKKAMKIESPDSVIAEACLEAVGYLKDPEGRNLVAENLKYGKPERARIGAMRAIINRGSVQEDELAVLKELLLGNKEFRVRQFLVDELIPKLGERRMMNELKEASQSDQDYRIRRRALEVYYELLSAKAFDEVGKVGDRAE